MIPTFSPYGWLETALGISPATQVKLFFSVLLVGVLAVLRWALLRLIYRRSEDVRLQYRARKLSAYVCVALGLLVVARIWFAGFREIGTYLGLLSAGLAIALKDLVASIAGWMYLLWRRPFQVGDRIQIGEHSGDVIDIRLFRFSLMEIGNWVAADQSTGRVIHIPNSRVITDVIANYSKGFEYIWNELPIMVTFESSWEKAKSILKDIVDRHGAHLSEAAMESVRRAGRKAMIHYQALTPKVWTSVADSGVLLTIRYLCEPRQRRSSAERVWEEILRAFGKCDDIDFAYPTMRRFINPDEGKPGTGGPPRASSSEKMGLSTEDGSFPKNLPLHSPPPKINED